MTKTLRCGAIVPGCQFVAHGQSEGDILLKATEHARTAHGMTRISEEFKEKVREAIKDE